MPERKTYNSERTAFEIIYNQIIDIERKLATLREMLDDVLAPETKQVSDRRDPMDVD